MHLPVLGRPPVDEPAPASNGSPLDPPLDDAPPRRSRQQWVFGSHVASHGPADWSSASFVMSTVGSNVHAASAVPLEPLDVDPLDVDPLDPLEAPLDPLEAPLDPLEAPPASLLVEPPPPLLGGGSCAVDALLGAGSVPSPACPGSDEESAHATRTNANASPEPRMQAASRPV